MLTHTSPLMFAAALHSAQETTMENVDNIIDFENGEQEQDETIAMFQRMINDGTAWRMQGSYGRQAMALIESGQCILGEVGHRDYYGNYVPSRTEVKPGTKGSVEYADAMQEAAQ